MGEQIIDELMGALKYDNSLIDGRGTLALDGVLAAELCRGRRRVLHRRRLADATPSPAR